MEVFRYARGDGLLKGADHDTGTATMHPRPGNAVTKRVFDIVLAALALLLLAPLMIPVAAVVRHISSGPVLFRKVRIGLHEQPFVMFRFPETLEA